VQVISLIKVHEVQGFHEVHGKIFMTSWALL